MKKIFPLILMISMTFLFSCQSSHYAVDKCPKWTIAYQDDIRNPDNEEFVVETANDLGISKNAVTQEQFNKRYLISDTIWQKTPYIGPPTLAKKSQ